MKPKHSSTLVVILMASILLYATAYGTANSVIAWTVGFVVYFILYLIEQFSNNTYYYWASFQTKDKFGDISFESNEYASLEEIKQEVREYVGDVDVHIPFFCKFESEEEFKQFNKK